MCLITFNWLDHSYYKLVLVANRDEFFDRPTAPLAKWQSGIYAGKDLKSGGTWMGFHPKGRFAALTNFRDFSRVRQHPISRGQLVKDYLEGDLAPDQYAKKVLADRDKYEGFNLLVADSASMYYVSSHLDSHTQVLPGLHGLSNASLDTPWKKVVDSKARLQPLLAQNHIGLLELTRIHHYKEEESWDNLPSTGLGKEMEKAISAPFIRETEGYGTVNITAVCWEKDGNVQILERRVKRSNKGFDDRQLTFSIMP